MKNLTTAIALCGTATVLYFVYLYFLYIVIGLIVVGGVCLITHLYIEENATVVIKNRTLRPAPQPKPTASLPKNRIKEASQTFFGGRGFQYNDGVRSITERYKDPDGRIYTLKYLSTGDGKHAVALCRKNPWGNTPNAGAEYHEGHVSPEGFLCLGSGHPSRSVKDSPYPIDYVVPRARYWCAAFSYFKETGQFPQL